MTLLHLDLLLALRPAKRYGLPVDTLLNDMRRGRHRELTLPELERELRNLADERFVVAQVSKLSGKRWHITATAERTLEEEGL